MREFREYGSARGALSNERPYRELSHSSATNFFAVSMSWGTQQFGKNYFVEQSVDRSWSQAQFSGCGASSLTL